MTALLSAGLTAWWSQLSSVEGALGVIALVLVFLNRPLLSWFEATFHKHIVRVPLKVPIVLLLAWIVLATLATAAGRIADADKRAKAAETKPTPELVRIPLDPNPQLTAKIAKQEGVITRLTSENRDLQRDLQTARDALESLRAQLRRQAEAADDGRKRAAIRAQLAGFMDSGRTLLNKYVESHADAGIEKQLNQWYAESLKYINDNLGTDYAAQYRQSTSSGLGIAGFPVAKMGIVDGINARLRHLTTFIDRLR